MPEFTYRRAEVIIRFRYWLGRRVIALGRWIIFGSMRRQKADISRWRGAFVPAEMDDWMGDDEEGLR